MRQRESSNARTRRSVSSPQRTQGHNEAHPPAYFRQQSPAQEIRYLGLNPLNRSTRGQPGQPLFPPPPQFAQGVPEELFRTQEVNPLNNNFSEQPNNSLRHAQSVPHAPQQPFTGQLFHPHHQSQHMFQQMPPHQQMHPHNQPQVNAPPLLYRENHHDYSTYNSFQPPTPNMPRQHDPQEQAVLASLQYPAWERYENGQSYNCAEHINVDQNNGQYMPQHYYGPSHGPLLGPDEMPCPGPGQLPPGPHQAVGMGGPNNMIHSGHRSHTQQPYHSQHHYHHQQGRGNMPPHMWQPSYHNARPQAGHPYRKGQQHQWQRPPHGQHHQYGRHHYGGQQQRGNKHGGRAANRKAFQFDGTTPAFVPQFQSNRQLELQILSQKEDLPWMWWPDAANTERYLQKHKDGEGRVFFRLKDTPPSQRKKVLDEIDIWVDVGTVPSLVGDRTKEEQAT